MKNLVYSIVFLIIANVLSAQIVPGTLGENYKCLQKTKNINKALQETKNQLLNNYDVKFYKLDISLGNTSTYIEGNVIINAVVQNNPLDIFVVELIDSMNVDSVFINSVNYSFVHLGDIIYVPVYPVISIGSSFTAQIYYNGDPSSSGFFSGISNDSDWWWGNQVTWTLSEPFNAKVWWPCKQALEDKADSVYVFITTDSTLKAGSNGILTAVVPLPGGKVRYEWKSNYPIDYYLISAAVASYVEYNIYAKPVGLLDSILIQNYVYDNPGCLPFYKSEIDKTAGLIELFSDLFGMYPFKDEKYGHCMAPLGGGMEHQTMTTLSVFYFWLVAHELGHQWFGDNVTCATWQDIWINEGLASYTEYVADQYLVSQITADDRMKNAHDTVISIPDGSVYIPFQDADNVGRIFDWRLSYRKGMALVHIIRFELQDDSVFFQVLRNFQEQYKDSVATGMDFKNVLEATSGMDFTDFFAQWYFGEGYPTYDITWYKHNNTLTFTAVQTASTATTPLFKMLMEYKVYYNGGDTIIQVYQTQNTQTFNVYLPYEIDSMEVDPNNWVLNKVGDVQMGVFTEFYSNSYFICTPNPFMEQITVRFFNNNIKREITLTDITGRIISKYNTKEPVYIINTHYLSNGIYLIKITDGEQTFVRKIVKQ